MKVWVVKTVTFYSDGDYVSSSVQGVYDSEKAAEAMAVNVRNNCTQAEVEALEVQHIRDKSVDQKEEEIYKSNSVYGDYEP